MDDIPAAHLETRVSQLLRGGVLVAGAILLVGMAALALRESGVAVGNDVVASFARSPEASIAFPRTLAGVWSELAAGHAVGFLQLGLLALIVLPALRVATTVVLFLAEGDRVHALIAATVLILMAFAGLE